MFRIWNLVIGICLVIVSWLLIIAPADAMGGPAPKKPENAPVVLAEKVFLIDDFESGSIKSPREWWTFDLAKAEAVSNKNLKGGDEKVALEAGNYSLLMSGPAKNWYAGGVGTYLAKEGQDLGKYSNFQMDVYGSGPGSGTLKVEIVDDDANSWSVEQDPAHNYVPIKDDLWGYEVRVDWDGWKRVTIPFSDFTLENPGKGDGVFNSQVSAKSHGLLQMQIVATASTADGAVNVNIDNVSLTTGK